MRRLSAPRAYYLYLGGWTLLWEMAVTLMMLFQVQVARLNAFQLVVVGTVMELTALVAEVPTGVVADLVSRKLSVLIGLVVMGVAFVMHPLWPTFVGLVIAQVVWAIGFTFTSGAADAWITDEVGEDRVLSVFTRGRQWGLALGIIGTLAAGGLGLWGSGVPILIAGIGFVILAVILAFAMPEDGFTPTPKAERETFSDIRDTLRTAVASMRRRGVVRSFMWVSLLGGLTSEVFDRLWTAWLLTRFGFPNWGTSNPAVWLTGIALVGQAIAFIALRVLDTRVQTETSETGATEASETTDAAAMSTKPRTIDSHPNRLLATLVLIRVGATALFAIAGSLPLALMALWTRNVANAVFVPIGNAWLNRNVTSKARATTLSLASQADAFGQVVGGPPFGALAVRTSIPIAMGVSALLLSPAAAILARLKPPAPGSPAEVPGEPDPPA